MDETGIDEPRTPTPPTPADPDPHRQEEEAILMMLGLGQLVGFSLVPIGVRGELTPVLMLLFRNLATEPVFVVSSWVGIAAMVVSPMFRRVVRHRVHLAGTAILAVALLSRLSASTSLVFTVLCSLPFAALTYVGYAYDAPRVRDRA